MTVSCNKTTVDLTALAHNYRTIQAKVGCEVQVMTVVKSDAYGHGMLPVARLLQDQGATQFAVAEAAEGVDLRQDGIAGRIVVLLGVFPQCFADALQYNLEPVVFDLDTVRSLAELARAENTEIGVHLKVDVGMGRLGIMPGEARAMIAEINNLAGVYLAGVLGHLPVADDPAPAITKAQCLEFSKLGREVIDSCPGPVILHLANSAALIRYPESYQDMVRPGISLYGYQPSADEGFPNLDLRPVMSFSSRVAQVKEVPKGYGISYGHTYVTGRRTRLAVLPVGYADGYLRKLSNRAEVLIKGQRAPVRGRVCMNACLVDITDVADVAPGDEVVLMGRQGSEEISAEEIAAWMDTISYEVLCLFGGANRHEYIRG